MANVYIIYNAHYFIELFCIEMVIIICPFTQI